MHNRVNTWMLVALASIVATAVMAAPVAAEDPQADKCAGLGNGPKNLDLTFTNTTVGEATAVGGDGALLCGSDFGDLDDPSDLGNMKGFTQGEIAMPFAHSKATGYISSLEARCANPVKNPGCTNEDGSGNLDEGRYMGVSTVSIFGTGGILKKLPMNDVPSNVYVNEAPGAGVPNTHCTADAVACYQAIDALDTGVGDIIIKVKQEAGSVVKRSKMTIYQPKSTTALVDTIYLTKIGPVDLCEYAGEVDADECGTDPADWANKVGPVATWHTCSPEVWILMGITFGGDPKKWTGGWGFDISTVSNVEGANDWWGNDPAWSDMSAKMKDDWDKYQAELSDYYRGKRGQKPKLPPSWKENGPGEAYDGITPTDLTDEYYDNNLKNPFCSEVTTTKADGTSDGVEEPDWSKEGSDGAGKPGASDDRNGKDSDQGKDKKDSGQSSSDSRNGAGSKSRSEKSKHRRSSHKRFSNG